MYFQTLATYRCYTCTDVYIFACKCTTSIMQYSKTYSFRGSVICYYQCRIIAISVE